MKRDTDDEDGEDGPEVDLYQLQVSTLRRFKKHLKVSTKPGLNKAQLAEVRAYKAKYTSYKLYSFRDASYRLASSMDAYFFQTLSRQFKTIPVNEKEVVTYFIYTVKTERNKLDSSSRGDGGNGNASGDYYDRY